MWGLVICIKMFTNVYLNKVLFIPCEVISLHPRRLTWSGSPAVGSMHGHCPGRTSAAPPGPADGPRRRLCGHPPPRLPGPDSEDVATAALLCPIPTGPRWGSSGARAPPSSRGRTDGWMDGQMDVSAHRYAERGCSSAGDPRGDLHRRLCSPEGRKARRHRPAVLFPAGPPSVAAGPCHPLSVSRASSPLRPCSSSSCPAVLLGFLFRFLVLPAPRRPDPWTLCPTGRDVAAGRPRAPSPAGSQETGTSPFCFLRTGTIFLQEEDGGRRRAKCGTRPFSSARPWIPRPRSQPPPSQGCGEARSAGEPSARTRNRRSCRVEASHGAAAGAGGIVRFYSPFLTLFVSETTAGFDRGSPGRRKRQEPLGRVRGRGWFCLGGSEGQGVPAPLPPCPPSLLRFNLLVIGFN